jgi:cytochrome c-type biogenesis protein CcmH
MKKSFWIFSFTLALTLALVGAACAQEPEPGPVAEGSVTDDAVNVIAKQLYCPVCENVPLDVCGTQACEQWRDEIRVRLARGESESEIKRYFVDNFGDRVLASPPPRGLNWLVYIVPPLAILAGAFILYRAFRTWKQPLPPVRPNPGGENTPAPSDPYIARLEEELRKR